MSLSLYDKIIALAAKFNAAIRGKASLSDLAPFYSDDQAYVVGQLVVKSLVLQVCTKAGTGNNAEFIPTTIGGAIASGGSAPAQVNADWNATSGAAKILNKPNSFSPSLHASTHAHNGSDAINPSSIKAVQAYPFLNIEPSNSITLESFTNNQLDMSSSSISAISVSIGPRKVENAMRDMWFVLKANVTAPAITWPLNTIPAGEDDSNLLAIDNATSIFLISEYSPDKFIVAKQVAST